MEKEFVLFKFFENYIIKSELIYTYIYRIITIFDDKTRRKNISYL